MRVYFDSDCKPELLKDKTIAVVGYGSQGHAHAANLRDSGVGRVIVALREDSSTRAKAQAAGFEVMTAGEAARVADFVMVLAPDESQAAIYSQELAQSLKEGATLMFAHGLNIHFSLIEPREDLDVIMVAPKGPGHQVRSAYAKGEGVPCLIAVHKDTSGKGFENALAYASAVGGGRAGILETSFREECETDLFGEQAVLCGGLTALIEAGFETLVEAGYAPEMAYFECLHEVKLITDLLYEGGMEGMRYSISNTAEFGDYVTGRRVITDSVKAAMKDVLTDIQSGKFTHDFVDDNLNGNPIMKARRAETAASQIEQVGKKLRGVMPFLQKNKLVDKTKN